MQQQIETKAAVERASFHKRVYTSIAIVVVISLAILSGSIGLFTLVFCINQLALLEYQRLILLAGHHIQRAAIQFVGLLLIVMVWLIVKQLTFVSILLLLLLLVPVLLFMELFRQQETPFQNVALTILGISWISIPLCLFLLISYWPLKSYSYHPFIILGYFSILWFGDTGAYLAGKFAGKHKLFSRISPKKTWEGSAGGLISACVAALLNSCFPGELQLHQWLVLALIINSTGTFGDFTKSMLKRNVGVKDSGNLLPGHGGILDRFDSLIGSVPFAFIYLVYYA